MHCAALVAFVATVPLVSQQATDSGPILRRPGTDTLVVDRFIRSADTLNGFGQIPGQRGMDSLAFFGPNEMGRAPAGRVVLQLGPAQGSRVALRDPTHIEWRTRAPAVSHIRFETTKGVFVLELHRDWGPIGADRVYNLARLGYFDDTRLHRVRADIAHFGIHGDPAINAVWSKAELPDDPRRSTNVRGTFALAFPARPDSRTTQIYINKTDNPRSDPDAFTVLGTVIAGMDVVDRLYAGYGEESGGGMRQGKQGPLLEEGNAFMDRTYPLLDRILQVTVQTVR